MAFITFQPNDYFNTKLYTGTGSSNALTGIGFQPDWTWIKCRTDAQNHALYDAVRGVQKKISSSTNTAEATATTELSAFGSDGFTVLTDGQVNASGQTYASWNWKANGAGSANTDGAINSTVSANTTSGFSIVSYTGTLSGNGNTTVGHGLGVAPKMIITKSKSNGENWGVYHKDLTANRILQLNTTSAQIDTSSEGTVTAPTSSVFTVNYRGEYGNSGQNYIAYCFAEKKGFSKFGSYTGNGSSDGNFLYCGFKPALFVVKRYDASGEYWNVLDSKRNPENPADDYIYWSENLVEGVKTQKIDFVSNGIKIRGTDGAFNASGGSYIYMCFAESSIVSSNGTPATAR